MTKTAKKEKRKDERDEIYKRFLLFDNILLKRGPQVFLVFLHYFVLLPSFK